jgi:hypothetical protein
MPRSRSGIRLTQHVPRIAAIAGVQLSKADVAILHCFLDAAKAKNTIALPRSLGFETDGIALKGRSRDANRQRRHFTPVELLRM